MRRIIGCFANRYALQSDYCCRFDSKTVAQEIGPGELRGQCAHLSPFLKARARGPGALSRVTVVRVLVVEDSIPFRKFISSILADVQHIQVVGEASDGLEAVQKAVELQPNLILLDIGLPGLNGLDVARQIRKLVPESRIIFLTQESSAHVVQEALSLGALGYVAKSMAAGELLAAIETVLLGQTYVSGISTL